MPRFNDNFYDRIVKATEALNENDINYTEHQKGRITVNKITYYAVSDTWKDKLNNTCGRGIATFIKYIKLKELLHSGS